LLCASIVNCIMYLPLSFWLSITFLKCFCFCYYFPFEYVMLMKCGNLGFGAHVCFFTIWNFMFHYGWTLNSVEALWPKTIFNWSLKNFNSNFFHVLLRYSGILGFGVQMCFLTIWNFAVAEDKICVIESVDGINEVFFDVSIIPS